MPMRTEAFRRKAGWLLLLLLVPALGLRAQQAFTESAAYHGIDLDDPKDGGFSFGDLNNDGYLDLIVNTHKDHPDYRSKMYFSSGPPNWTFSEVTNTHATGINDAVSTDEDTPVSIDVLANDSDPDAALIPGNVSLLSGTSNGNLTLNPDGTFSYTPDDDWFGTDGFSYVYCDADGACDTANVVITVLDVNDPPIANDDSESTPEDTPVTTDVLANDNDPDGSLLPASVVVLSPPANGTVTVNPDGTITYSPDPDFTGTDSYTYQVCDDDGDCASATVTVNVTPVNDPPVAVDDTDNTTEDTPVTTDVLANDSDVDGTLDIGSVVVLSPPANGTVTVNPDGTITYTPNPDYHGPDSFSYQVCDDDGACDAATVSISVGDVNDPPLAVNDNATTDEDTPVAVDILLNDSDPDGSLDPSAVSLVSGPSNGTAYPDPITGELIYTPNPNWNGVDSLVYEVCDDDGACDQAIVIITVLDVNDPPVAVDDNATTPEDTPVDIPVLDNDIEGDYPIDAGTLAILSGPNHGTVFVSPGTGEVTYTPSPDWCGTDSFVYRICDTWGYCDTATVYLIVECVELVANDDYASTDSGDPVTIDILANDSPNADPDCVSFMGDPSHGTAVLNADGTVTYTLDPGFVGEDCWPYRVCDTLGVEFDDAIICVTVELIDLTIPEVFTPNGDGFNETFEIVGIEQYPDNRIMVFNRWETQVYEAEGYRSEWNGIWMKNGEPLPDGTYYYVLELDPENPDGKVFKGFVQIQR